MKSNTVYIMRTCTCTCTCTLLIILFSSSPQATWSEGIGLAVSMSIRLPIMVPTPLSTLVPTASDDGISVMKEMLQWNPRKRPTAKQVRETDPFTCTCTCTCK